MKMSSSTLLLIVAVSMLVGVFIQDLSAKFQKDFLRDNTQKIRECESKLPRNKFCELVAVPK